MVTFFKVSKSKWVVTAASTLSFTCLVFGTYQFLSRGQSSQVSVPLSNPQPQTLQVVAALGRVEPDGEVITVGGPTGDRIGRLLVQEGQQVKAGQMLAYLESYQERLAERQLAASQLQEAQVRFETETQFGQAQIQEAQSRLKQVELPQPLEISSQQATVRRLEIELETAKKTAERFQKLQAEGAISQQTLDEKVLVSNSKQEELNSVKATLAKLIQERNTSLLNAQTQIQSARANLQRSQSQVTLESAQGNLNLTQARLERTVILAPGSGQILRVIAHQGETITQEGILQLGNTQQMNVVAEVYETDITKLQVDQKATVTSSALSQELQGVVAHIGRQISKKDVLGNDPVADRDSRVVEVRIRLNPEDSKLVADLTNLQVKVKIHFQ